jgi:hypothetical protein
MNCFFLPRATGNKLKFEPSQRSFFDIFDIVKYLKFSNDEKKNHCRQLENE